MSTIKIYTQSGEKIYFHDTVEAKFDDEKGMIKITQKNGDFNSESWLEKTNIICIQTFISENDALYFEPILHEEVKKELNNDNLFPIISITVNVFLLILIIILSLI